MKNAYGIIIKSIAGEVSIRKLYAAIFEFPLMPEGRGAKRIPFSVFIIKLTKHSSNKPR